MASNDLISFTEACRRLEITRTQLTRLCRERGIKVVMRGRVRLVHLNDIKMALKKRKKAQSKPKASYENDYIDHLKKTIVRLQDENKELREERRQNQEYFMLMMQEAKRLRLEDAPTPGNVIDCEDIAPPTPTQAKRQGASANPEDLEDICRILDEHRGLSKEQPQEKPGFINRIFARPDKEL